MVTDEMVKDSKRLTPLFICQCGARECEWERSYEAEELFWCPEGFLTEACMDDVLGDYRVDNHPLVSLKEVLNGST